MLYTLRIVWQYDHTNQTPDVPQADEDIYYGQRWSFDSNTRTIVFADHTTDGSLYAGVQVAFGGVPPTNYQRPGTEEFYWYVDGADRYGYYNNETSDVVAVTVVKTTLTATYTSAGFNCFGTRNVMLTVTPAGMAGPFTYRWSDGVTTKDRMGLGAASYSLLITDTPSGAQRTLDITVEQNDQIILEIIKTGSGLTVVASGGTPGYTYRWDDGATTASRTGLDPATYRCVVRDSRGCTASISGTIGANRFYFSHDPIVLALDAGQDYRNNPTTKPNLSFVCEVFVERTYLSGVFELAGQAEEQPADRDGRTVFEVQELLEPYVSPQLPTLDPRYRTDVVRSGDNFKRFYLRYQERVAGVLVGTLTTELSYVVYGGLSFEEAARGTWFDGWFFNRRPFLTWEPVRKKVQRAQPEYLSYLVPTDAITSVNRRVRVYLSDGSVSTFQNSGYGPAKANEVYLIPVGFTDLRLSRYETGARRVQRWDVAVTDQNGTEVSEVRTYVLDTRYRATTRYFIYVNSLGGFNTVSAHGRAELQLASKTTSSPLPRVAGYDAVRGDVEVDRRTGLPTLKVYTGARSAEQTLADTDFLLSPRVLLYDSDRFRAGTVKDRTATVFDEDATRRVLQFDFEMPRERHYTPRLLNS
ncbi:SprB repeat-containing protein [Hymenobacter sp. YC55]|uniref:SprB repeat-containing protein n=1 Tax=Hymenobacter sp. YC55 TaxID=3034019 RepID=UPI0023F9DE93|nr:SprB repeat-containing protein [Hymenobacter sp. YC55]MDF7810515.1 SprB repeat-containing protein [Hymenobacter sp. YC55]